jgi:sulfate adenylyltransferase subunit 1
MIARPNNQPAVCQEVELMMCWLDNKSLNPTGKYILRHTSNEVRAKVKEVRYKVDVNTLHRNEEDLEIKMNDIARVKLRLAKPIFTDSYSKNRITGSVILIDEATNNTVASGMII